MLQTSCRIRKCSSYEQSSSDVGTTLKWWTGSFVVQKKS